MGNIFHDINEEILSLLGWEGGRVGVGRSSLDCKSLIKLERSQIVRI